MAERAVEIVRANGYEDVVQVIKGRIEEIDLPEKADLIISEPMGFMLLHERMLEVFALAREKWGKPGCKMFPTTGTIYIAPGGRHLGIDRRLGHITAAIGDGPPVRFCRPAVDVLFNDAARHLGSAALGLVLTGMGSDGTEGAGALRRAGAAVIAQDEQSSTIWGMPGSVVRAQQASAVIPLDDIGPAIRSLVKTGQPL